MTRGQGIELFGLFTFTVIRILIATGLVRMLIRGERIAGGINGLDWLILGWALLAITSSIFHNEPSAALVLRLGLVYDACGVYFLIRSFCQSMDDVIGLCRTTAILLIPLAVEMLYEKQTVHNLFSMFGGVSENPAIRDGKIRAQGPFAHAILAGTIGAVNLPLTVAIWSQYRKTAILGITACLTIVFASTSSGPIMSAIAAIGALFMWRYRHKMKLIHWAAVLAYIVLALLMKDPVYYLMARIDITGGSTGWHRARLIESAFEHFNEWWLAGTDYTRHWMPTGVSWSPNHTDITNHYLRMGVIGGLPLMLIFIASLAKGFSYVGNTLRHATKLSPTSLFVVWALGASLFANAVTFLAVSYFDQSSVFIYLILAAIGSMWSTTIPVGAAHMAATEDRLSTPATE
jgi:hypothetical protein